MVNSLPTNAGDMRDAWSISGLGSFPGGGHGSHSSILAWRSPWTDELWLSTVHRVTKSQTRLKRLSTNALLKLLFGNVLDS